MDELAECLATRRAPAEAEEVTGTQSAKPHLRAVLKRVLPVVAVLLVVALLVRGFRGRHR